MVVMACKRIKQNIKETKKSKTHSNNAFLQKKDSFQYVRKLFVIFLLVGYINNQILRSVFSFRLFFYMNFSGIFLVSYKQLTFSSSFCFLV